MAAAQRAIPSHLRDGPPSNGDAGKIKPRHHGKSQSHMVSAANISPNAEVHRLPLQNLWLVVAPVFGHDLGGGAFPFLQTVQYCEHGNSSTYCHFAPSYLHRIHCRVRNYLPALATRRSESGYTIPRLIIPSTTTRPLALVTLFTELQSLPTTYCHDRQAIYTYRRSISHGRICKFIE